MAKERFKVGDKVLPIYPEFWAQGNNIGKVISIDPNQFIIVQWKWNDKPEKSAYHPEEIKHVNQNGQLLFSFMYEN